MTPKYNISSITMSFGAAHFLIIFLDAVFHVGKVTDMAKSNHLFYISSSQHVHKYHSSHMSISGKY